jgi:hypothetical protein
MATVLGLLLHCLVVLASVASATNDATQHPLVHRPNNATLISQDLFWELEELARIVDIAYCVGTAGLGIQKPFRCASHCSDRDFETFELVTVCAACSVPTRISTVLTTAGVEHRPVPF